MLFINAIILAIVQGLTEFLPVSSSGHLVVLHDFLNLQTIDNLTFDIALHFGTALALIIFFRKEIWHYLKAFGQMFVSFNLRNEDQKTVLNLLLATIPAALAGFFLEEYLENYFRSTLVVAIALIIGGILFFIVEKFSKKQRSMQDLSIPEAFIIGCSQALALIPGVSRSGITIITGMSINLNRAQAAKFSFLLSIPIVLGASIKKFFDVSWSMVQPSETMLFVIGVLASLITGFFVIKYFLKFLEKRSLTVFGIYRIILGIVLILLIFI